MAIATSSMKESPKPAGRVGGGLGIATLLDFASSVSSCKCKCHSSLLTATGGYLRTVCDYVHLNPVRAMLLKAGDALEPTVGAVTAITLNPPTNGRAGCEWIACWERRAIVRSDTCTAAGGV
jgi:hypothetical protein